MAKIKTSHMMKVKDLRKQLKDMPDDAFVILQKDAEGNGYSPLCGLDQGTYVPDSTWSGEILPENVDPKDYGPSLKAVVLFPVN